MWQKMRWLFSVRTQLTLALALCAAGAVAGWWFLTSRQHSWQLWIGVWLVAVNIVTFVYYGLDKLLARKFGVIRIPETVLHTLAAIGGSPAAVLAIWIFRHKTIKSSFRVLFWSIVVVQIAAAGYIVKTLWWN